MGILLLCHCLCVLCLRYAALLSLSPDVSHWIIKIDDPSGNVISFKLVYGISSFEQKQWRI